MSATRLSDAAAAQLQKAVEISIVLERKGLKSADIGTLSDREWLKASWEAGYTAPSESTRRRIAQVMAQHEVASTRDVFDLFQPPNDLGG